MIVAVLALALATAPAPEARFEAANAAYLAGDFATAADAYGALVAEGYESPTLHLNRGNALLRLGRRGPAIASWERALRLAPGDRDARANLALARGANVDRVVGGEDRSFLARVVARFSDGGAAALFLGAWIALWTALVLRRRTGRATRAPLAAAAIAAAALSVAAGALLAAKAAERRTPGAIVIQAVAPVREGPSRTLRAAFELHEGTRVRVMEAREDVVRVRLENGLEGWIATEAIELI